MNLIAVDRISKAYDEKVLLRDLSFGIAEGEKISLVGQNGMGKSTLLAILAGVVAPDAGKIMKNQACQWEYLEQNPQFQAGLTVLEQIFDHGSAELDELKEYTWLLQQCNMYPTDPIWQDRLQKQTDVMERLHLWNMEEEVKNILSQLGFTDWQQKVETLSGGQKRRLALARALIRPANLLLLDEPTNHLDLESILWLENKLQKRKTALLMVTHDREFLNRVSQKIFELDGGKLYVHQGDFQHYLTKKEERLRVFEEQMNKKQALYRQELDWIHSGVQGRGTKQVARSERFVHLEKEVQYNRERDMDLSFPMQRLGKKIIELEHVSKSFQNKMVIKDFTYTFKKGDCIGLVGPNGTGKTTFLKLLTESIEPDHGTIVRGETLRIGFLMQHLEQLDESLTLMQTVIQKKHYSLDARNKEVSAAQWLERFLFSRDKQQTKVEKLSGGERRRLAILNVLMDEPNVLLLDEPTNDLDLDTLLVLEDFLCDFPGILLVVSHDRTFLNKSVNSIFEFTRHGAIRRYSGNYNDYLLKKEQGAKEKKANKTEEKPKTLAEQREGDTKLSYMDKKEFSRLEEAIPLLEQEIVHLEKALLGCAEDYSKLQEIHQTLEHQKSNLEDMVDQWMRLAEKMEGASSWPQEN